MKYAAPQRIRPNDFNYCDNCETEGYCLLRYMVIEVLTNSAWRALPGDK